ncbi:ABC transporter permease [Pseudonocardia oroxyli]|uniref:Peptide/nickel transport system permease protein n=1 Tax=Pseudonocardia oroxyli TaxID=366584 RepID=A0A1G8CAI1_PSEOR|nr:ABC transporter permease [Pseudonocardia oroxyli]SDH42481.1 peptide/nickel transport system permease protein [Pseudonocardia oroxyli]
MTVALAKAPVEAPSGTGPRRRRGPRIGLALAAVWLLVVALAVFVPHLLAPGDPLAGVPALKLQPPSAHHWWGTDEVGRDLYTRVVHGAGLTMSTAVLAVAMGVLLGSALGLLAGLAGGIVDVVVMRVVDVLFAVPGILLSLALITVLGAGTAAVAFAVSVGSIAGIARVLRSEVLKVRTSPYVEAAQVSGNRPLRLTLRHVLPNAVTPLLALAALELAAAILSVSALGFLGYGAQPPAPEWGAMVASGRDSLRTAWWLTTVPGLAIVATVLAANRVSLLGGRRLR